MIALIGGSGFIGSRLAERLGTKGLIILDRRPSPLGRPVEIVDVARPETLRAPLVGCRALVNLAAEHRDDVRPRGRYDEVNVQGAWSVCQVARKLGIERIVFTSSVAVYGFAPPETGERGAFKPFNDYGRTKAAAEMIYREWQAEVPERRTLVIVRPTVVFGEGNRGNMYNLLRQIASGRFVMVGNGKNRKSMAYVENVAAFIQHCIDFPPGTHVYNYVDKPDFDMKNLVKEIHRLLGRGNGPRFRVHLTVGYTAAACCDLAAVITRRNFPVSRVRVKKFSSDTVFATSAGDTGFVPPIPLDEGLARTVRYEFVEQQEGPIFYTE